MNEFLETMFAIVTAASQLDRLKQCGPHFALRVENGRFMPLTIEAWPSPIAGEGRRRATADS